MGRKKHFIDLSDLTVKSTEEKEIPLRIETLENLMPINLRPGNMYWVSGNLGLDEIITKIELSDKLNEEMRTVQEKLIDKEIVQSILHGFYLSNYQDEDIYNIADYEYLKTFTHLVHYIDSLNLEIRSELRQKNVQEVMDALMVFADITKRNVVYKFVGHGTELRVIYEEDIDRDETPLILDDTEESIDDSSPPTKGDRGKTDRTRVPETERKKTKEEAKKAINRKLTSIEAAEKTLREVKDKREAIEEEIEEVEVRKLAVEKEIEEAKTKKLAAEEEIKEAETKKLAVEKELKEMRVRKSVIEKEVKQARARKLAAEKEVMASESTGDASGSGDDGNDEGGDTGGGAISDGSEDGRNDGDGGGGKSENSENEGGNLESENVTPINSDGEGSPEGAMSRGKPNRKEIRRLNRQVKKEQEKEAKKEQKEREEREKKEQKEREEREKKEQGEREKEEQKKKKGQKKKEQKKRAKKDRKEQVKKNKV